MEKLTPIPVLVATNVAKITWPVENKIKDSFHLL
jgi:hypothetical protein